MNWRAGWDVLKDTFREFSEDEAMSLAAGLAFYAALGLAPTVLLAISVASWLGEGAQQEMIDQIGSIVGSEGAEAITMIVQSADQKPKASAAAAILGAITLLASASGIFSQLQTALNRIWDVRVREHSGVTSWIRARAISAGILIATLFLLMVSLVVSASLAFFSPMTGPLAPILDFASSWLVYVGLFALIFKFLPDVEIDWRDTWMGAALTATLFVAGKAGIAFYLGQSAMASSYGAAGSLVALLAWTYYSATIVFFGAELTQVIASRFGAGIRPSAHAVRESSAAA